jgi:hypothetical protein
MDAPKGLVWVKDIGALRPWSRSRIGEITDILVYEHPT